MTDLSLVQELLADLGKQIAEEEAKVRERIDRISQHDDLGIEDEIREEWNLFHMHIKPMREQQEYILKQLATLENMKRPAPMVMPAGVSRIP